MIEVFGLERLIGGTPNATIFQFAFCLLLYSQTQLIRAYVAKHQQRDRESLWTEQLFVDVRQELIAWAVVIPADAAVTLPKTTAEQTCQRLDELLRPLWSDPWIKSAGDRPRNRSRPPRTNTHTSAYRALNADNRY